MLEHKIIPENENLSGHHSRPVVCNEDECEGFSAYVDLGQQIWNAAARCS